MYYPEANVLVGRGVDPLSRTPAFKGTTIRVASADTAHSSGAEKPAEALPIQTPT
jgi:hypothetical protein